MLFRRRIEKSCKYCAHSTRCSQDQMLCTKRGIVSVTYACRKFLYDPFKRIPVKPKAPDFHKFDNDDFSL